MINVFLYSLVSVFLISIISFIGIFTLFLKKEILKKVLLYLVSFTAGALFAQAFIHLIPESLSRIGPDSTILVLVGILLFFVIEKFLRWHHCHNSGCPDHKAPIATINLIGDGVHNFVDGLLIAASFTVSLPLGISTSLAILLHEIPQEIGDFGVLVHGGMKPKKALIFNFLTAITAIFGVVIFFTLGSFIEGFAYLLLPITAGGFIYIAGSDLVPELHRESNSKKIVVQFAFMLLGIFLMYFLRFIE